MSRRHPLRSLVLVLLTAAVTLGGLLAAPAGTADAHRNDESYLYLDVGDASLSGRAELPYDDLRSVFDFELSGSVDELLDELDARVDELQSYLLAETSIGAAGIDWPIEFDGVELLEEEGVGPNGFGYAVLPFDVELDGGEVPAEIEVTFTPFLDEIDNRTNITLIANDWKRGVVEEETNELVFHTADSPSGTINLGESDQWGNFRNSIDLGVDHIRTGPDHIFFVMVLLLPSVLVLASMAWKPADRFGSSLLRVVIVATMFTIAHSVTFTLAGLDLMPLPPAKVTESLIALSIAAAAIHNIKPILGHREWAIAFAFGLFHGMGFAGLISDLDINRSTQLVSLLGRNVGIEIGQLVIIFITFPTLFLLRRTRAFLPLMFAASAALAAMSLTWVYERVFERDTGINGLIDSIVLWPRSLWAMVVVTMIAGAYHLFERQRGALLSTVDEEGDVVVDHVDDERDSERIDVLV
jgi:hypothetical protein